MDTVLQQGNAPADTVQIQQLADSVQAALQAANAIRPQLQQNMQAAQIKLSQLTAPSTAPAVPSGSPATEQLSGGTISGFQVNATAAGNARSALLQRQQDIGRREPAAPDPDPGLRGGAHRARIAAGGSSGFVTMVGQYGHLESLAQQQFALQADFILEKQDWARQTRVTLEGDQSALYQMLSAQEGQLSTSDVPDLELLATTYVTELAAWTKDQQILSEFQNDNLANERNPSRLAWWADSAGRALWYLVGDTGLVHVDDSATVQFAALNQTATTRLGAVRAAHLALSQSLGQFFAGQAALEGELYDLYSAYQSLAGSATPAAMKTRLTQLAQDLTTPTLTSVQAIPIPSGRPYIAKVGGRTVSGTIGGSPYSAEVQFTWTGQQPTGTSEFLYNVVGGASTALGSGSAFLSNGGAGTWTSWLWTPDRVNGGTVDSTFQAGVRGGAGFVGYGGTNYSVTFPAGGSAPASATGGSQIVSSQPPSTPVVTFPDNPANGARVWSNDPSSVFAAWSASDPVSGIASYQYAVSASRTAPASASDWVSAGGRTSVTIGQQKLSATLPSYVLVRATNGQGITGAVGASRPIYYDSTPPLWPTRPPSRRCCSRQAAPP